jgi:hypothetical protein
MKKFTLFKITIIIIIIGIQKGWNHPTLPKILLKLQLHPFIIIFRVIGGIILLINLINNFNFS